uniref:Uncharacterized protein n=1 Tax=Ananas comosus var. bracteatus TaxID=296719 RepID=A0A6V7PSA9_ANACO|nr:unnamed protein product [Ananas comosus var. bracteatus]
MPRTTMGGGGASGRRRCRPWQLATGLGKLGSRSFSSLPAPPPPPWVGCAAFPDPRRPSPPVATVPAGRSCRLLHLAAAPDSLGKASPSCRRRLGLAASLPSGLQQSTAVAPELPRRPPWVQLLPNLSYTGCFAAVAVASRRRPAQAQSSHVGHTCRPPARPQQSRRRPCPSSTAPITFNMICKMLLSLEDDNEMEALRNDVSEVTEALLAFPLRFPVTRFNKGIKIEIALKNSDTPLRLETLSDMHYASKV